MYAMTYGPQPETPKWKSMVNLTGSLGKEWLYEQKQKKKFKKGKRSIKLAFVHTNSRQGKCPEESSGTRERHMKLMNQILLNLLCQRSDVYGIESINKWSKS